MTMTTEPLGDIWAQLEHAPGPPGTVYRRLHPQSRRDLRAELDRSTAARTLVFERSWRPSDELPPLRQSQAVRMQARRSGDGARMTLLISLSDPAFTDVFSVLVGDVAAAAAAADGDHAATVALLEQLERWRRILEDLHDNGLSAMFRRGLFAELHVLGGMLITALGPRTAVAGWTGPLRTNQDFQYPGGAVEVKSTVGAAPGSVTVANERELDDTGTGSLHLVHVSLDERRGGQGRSLNEAVSEIEDSVEHDITARGLLRERLVHYGYHAHQADLYDEPRYTVRTTGVYRVGAGFPRIVESQLPTGVGAVRYTVALSACEPHRVDENTLTAALTGAAGPAAEHGR
jgi:hypothetical protein